MFSRAPSSRSIVAMIATTVGAGVSRSRSPLPRAPVPPSSRRPRGARRRSPSLELTLQLLGRSRTPSSALRMKTHGTPLAIEAAATSGMPPSSAPASRVDAFGKALGEHLPQRREDRRLGGEPVLVEVVRCSCVRRTQGERPHGGARLRRFAERVRCGPWPEGSRAVSLFAFRFIALRRGPAALLACEEQRTKSEERDSIRSKCPPSGLSRIGPLPLSPMASDLLLLPGPPALPAASGTRSSTTDPFYFDNEANRAICREGRGEVLPPGDEEDPRARAAPRRSPSECRSRSPARRARAVRERGRRTCSSSSRKLVATGACEFLAETSHHSLTFLVSRGRSSTSSGRGARDCACGGCLYSQPSVVFRNTELNVLERRSRDAISPAMGRLRRGAVRGRRPPARLPLAELRLRTAAGARRVIPLRDAPVKLLLKNYRLSDDIAFRFSDRNWHGVAAHRRASSRSG